MLLGLIVGFLVGTIAGFALASLLGANERSELQDRLGDLLAYCNRCAATNGIDRSGHPEIEKYTTGQWFKM